MHMKICAFIGDMYRDYSSSIIRHIDAYARKKRHRVDIFGNCSIPNTNPLQVIGYTSIFHVPDLHSYDGIIVCLDTIDHTGMGKELIDSLLADPECPPVVCIRAEINGFFNVIPDNRDLMREITGYVISKCKTDDIGFVTGRDDLVDSAERRAGFEDAMHDAGYEVAGDLVFHGNYWIDQGPEMADFFIRRDGSLPEAIVCSNDYMAIALADELIARGYSVPGDVLISGVDNLTEGADHIPSITTIEISNKDLALSAVKLLEDINAKNNPDLYVTVSGNIIPRESTGDGDPGRDVYKAVRDLKLARANTIDAMRQFSVISAVFDNALTNEAAINVTLENLRAQPSVRSCYLVRYRESGRELVGSFKEKGDITVTNLSFPNEKLLPRGFMKNRIGSYVYVPISYANAAYGYAVLDVTTSEHFFINETMEFILIQYGQIINRLDIYQKLFGMADIMEVYTKDPLTGLLNRRGFESKLTEQFDEIGNKRHDMAIASIDMDGLKYINDNFGHNSGDEAIREVAKCIDNALKPGEFVARMGGDEFSAIIDLTNVGRLGQFMRTVRNNIKDVNDSGKYKYELGASIGTCRLTRWRDLIECINKADKAMYIEKRAKKKNRR